MTASRSRYPTLSTCLLLLLLTIAARGMAAEGSDPLQNEDVVKMTLHGMPTDSIIRTIREASTPEFDLGPEMVVELRRAGVVEAVIEAMREAMRQSVPETANGPIESEPVSAGWLKILFQDDEKMDEGRNSIILPERNDLKEKTALAFYVFCVEPTHAPHMWQTLTPLRVNFTRHHMLLFHEATEPYKRGLVRLGKPNDSAVEAEEGRHLIHVGVAARSGENDWFPVIDTTGILEVTRGEVASVTIRLRTRRGHGRASGRTDPPVFECEIVEEPGSDPE